MGGVDKEKKPDVPAQAKVNKGQNYRQGGCHNRNRWNNVASGGSTTTFVGKTPGRENNIFDNTGAHDAHIFHCSLKHIANYVYSRAALPARPKAC